MHLGVAVALATTVREQDFNHLRSNKYFIRFAISKNIPKIILDFHNRRMNDILNLTALHTGENTKSISGINK